MLANRLICWANYLSYSDNFLKFQDQIITQFWKIFVCTCKAQANSIKHMRNEGNRVFVLLHKFLSKIKYMARTYWIINIILPYCIDVLYIQIALWWCLTLQILFYGDRFSFINQYPVAHTATMPAACR